LQKLVPLVKVPKSPFQAVLCWQLQADPLGDGIGWGACVGIGEGVGEDVGEGAGEGVGADPGVGIGAGVPTTPLFSHIDHHAFSAWHVKPSTQQVDPV
jgi:hypothetical protein